jgi:hypothetical protein
MGGVNLAVRAASGETLTAMDYLNQLLIQPLITSLTLTLSVGGAFAFGMAVKAAWIFGEAGKEFISISAQLVKGLTFAVSTAGASVFGGMLSAAANKQSLYSSKTWEGIGYGVAVGAALGFFGGGMGTKFRNPVGAFRMFRRASRIRRSSVDGGGSVNAREESTSGLGHPSTHLTVPQPNRFAWLDAADSGPVHYDATVDAVPEASTLTAEPTPAHAPTASVTAPPTPEPPAPAPAPAPAEDEPAVWMPVITPDTGPWAPAPPPDPMMAYGESIAKGMAHSLLDILKYG